MFFLNIIFQYLAVHSPVFASMFFNDFAEKGKEEVDLNEIVYEVCNRAFFSISHLQFFAISRFLHFEIIYEARPPKVQQMKACEL